MMKKIVVLFCLLFSTVATAGVAELVAVDTEKNLIVVAIDRDGIARVNDDTSTHPTINDYRADNGYAYVCYDGAIADVKVLFTALVLAADSSGDSSAELKSLVVNKRLALTLVVSFQGKSGTHEELLTFAHCR